MPQAYMGEFPERHPFIKNMGTDGWQSQAQRDWSNYHQALARRRGWRKRSVYEYSLYRDWLFEPLEQAHESRGRALKELLADYEQAINLFVEDWRCRKTLRPHPWYSELLTEMQKEQVDHQAHAQWETGDYNSHLDDVNMEKLYLWGHIEEWRRCYPVEAEISTLRLPKERMSQLFLIDFLVHRTWDLYTLDESWGLFKALITADGLTVQEMSKAALIFPKVAHYPSGWWAPLLTEANLDWKRPWRERPALRERVNWKLSAAPKPLLPFTRS